jgi:PhnB protein
MYATLRIGSNHMMCGNRCCDGKTVFNGLSLSLAAANEAEAERLFNAVAAGGRVQMPLAKIFRSHRFRMVANRFGMRWMVSVAGQ